MINLKGDVKEITKSLNKIERKVIPLAVPAALNKTSAKINTQIKRYISQNLGIPQKTFSKRVKVYRATRRDWTSKNWVGLKIKIPVSSVYKSTNRQIRYTKGLNMVGQNEIFVATMGSGHTGIFYKKQNAKRSSGYDSKGRTRKNRLPIQEVMIDLTDDAQAAVKKFGPPIAKQEFTKLLAHELKYRLTRVR